MVMVIVAMMIVIMVVIVMMVVVVAIRAAGVIVVVIVVIEEVRLVFKRPLEIEGALVEHLGRGRCWSARCGGCGPTG